MTKTVIEMAREAGFETEITGIGEVVLVCNFQGSETDVTKELGRFAALVREDEREKLKQQLSKPDYMVDAPVVHPLKAEVVMTFKQQEPVAWMKNQFITDDAGFNIGTDDPEVHFGKDCPEDSGWWPVYAETISTQKPVVFRYKEYPLDTRSSWHYVTKRKAIPDGFPFQELYTTPPTAAIAARQMRDAAVKVCRDKEKEFSGDAWEASFFVIAANAIAALPVQEVPLPKTLEGGYELCEDEGCPHRGTVHYCRSVPEFKWRDLTDDEIDMLIDVEEYIRTVTNQISVSNKLKAVIAKFKEKQL